MVQTGPCRWVGHPSYTGGSMVLPGIGRTPGNWLRPVLIVVLSTIGPARRMRVEEAALLGTTGEPSARYAPGQPRLFHRL